MSTPRPLKNVAVFGAGGTNIGHHTVKVLHANPAFKVSIIARKSSKSTFPEGVTVHYVDDNLPHDQLVKAFEGVDAVVSAIGFGAIDLERNLIDAAIEAGVQRFLPSEYGVNNTNPVARALSPVFDAKGEICEYLKSKEPTGLTWTAVPNGLWLEWALEPAISFADINIKSNTAKLWQNGTHSLSWSTLRWAAEGIAEILLNPEKTANKVVPIRAFEATQLDIISFLEKAQNVKYTISHHDHTTAIKDAQASWKANKDINSALYLVKAGFLLDGYGSNFSTESITQNGNEYLDLPALSFEEVMEEVVKKWA